jgi:transcriptional regulator with XRE-family HTH domain
MRHHPLSGVATTGGTRTIHGKPAGLLVSTTHTLRQWRKLKGYGQRELARLAGLSHTAASDLEQGKTKGLPATWRKLAVALGVDVTQILEYRRGDAPSSR